MVMLLLRVESNIRGSLEQAALHLAAQSGQEAAVELLLKNGGEVDPGYKSSNAALVGCGIRARARR